MNLTNPLYDKIAAKEKKQEDVERRRIENLMKNMKKEIEEKRKKSQI